MEVDVGYQADNLNPPMRFFNIPATTTRHSCAAEGWIQFPGSVGLLCADGLLLDREG